LDYAKEQEAERRREWDIQSKAAQAQWDTQQANLEPYRKARAAILRKHGIEVPDVIPPKPPDFSSGPPPGWKPGDPLSPGGSAAAAPKRGGGMGGALALGALGGAAAAFPSLYDKYRMSNTSQVAGPPRSMIQGGPIPDLPTPDQYNRLAGLGGPNGGTVPTGGLSNWSGYTGATQYGIPDQNYYGE